MDRPFEDKLVAVLEAVGAPLPRGQIYERVDDDVESEEDLAKILGRLVASGRLLRSSRETPDQGKEFVYSVPGASRLDAIAAAAHKVQTSALPPHQEKTPMKDAHDKLVEFLEESGEWLPPGKIAEACGMNRVTGGYRLVALAKEGKIQTVGERRGLRYAALDVEAPADGASKKKDRAPAPPAPDKPRRGKRRRGPRIPCGPGAEASAQLPVPAARNQEEQLPDVKCAIEDTGLFALNNGLATIRMKPAQIRKVVAFLELTQHVWQKAA